jgi:hypothetical protein
LERQRRAVLATLAFNENHQPSLPLVAGAKSGLKLRSARLFRPNAQRVSTGGSSALARLLFVPAACINLEKIP